jgi:hypothetical protein
MKKVVGLLQKLKEFPWYEWVQKLRDIDPVVVEGFDDEEEQRVDYCSSSGNDDALPEMWNPD